MRLLVGIALVMIALFCVLCTGQTEETSGSKFTVNPIVNDHFVAEILDLDLETLNDEDFHFLEEQLLHYKVVVVRNQPKLTVEGQRRFSQRFGSLHVHLESASHHKGYNDVNLVSNIKNEEGKYIGLYGRHVENYHTDLSWSPMPCKVTILKSEIRPETCGDTQYLDTVAAYDALSPAQQSYYRSLLAKYCYLNHRNVTERGDSDNLSAEEVAKAKQCAVHPVITQHPITGAYNIYANPSHTRAILFQDDATDDADARSAAMLQELYDHTNQPDKFGYTHVWRDFDVVIWDNRAVHHRATGCPDEEPRLLVRTTVNNDEVPRGDVAPFELVDSARSSEL